MPVFTSHGQVAGVATVLVIYTPTSITSTVYVVYAVYAVVQLLLKTLYRPAKYRIGGCNGLARTAQHHAMISKLADAALVYATVSAKCVPEQNSRCVPEQNSRPTHV
jgi:hypothetical protein